MRAKQKRTLAIAVLVLLANVALYVYEQYNAQRPEDILRQSAAIATLGPALPPEELEEQLTKEQRLSYPQNTNSTATTSIRVQFPPIKLKPRAVTDKFLFHSYLKSGGSHVAEVLNLHFNEVFYLHHPLYNLDRDIHQTGTNILDSKTSREGLIWLQNIYNCSFSYKENLLHEPLLWKSHSIRNTYRTRCQQLQITDCIEHACKQRSLRAVLTTRLSVEYLYQLLKVYGDTFKVIVILRDPRSVLSNRHRDKVGNPLPSINRFKQEASKLCTAMGTDLKYVKKINNIYPGSIMVLQYEHFLLHPLEVLNYLYDFLGLEVSDAQIHEILRIIKLNIPEDQLLQLTKIWQLDLTLQESRAVDEGCNSYYKSLGYFPVPQNINSYNKYFITWNQAKDIIYRM